SRHQVTALADAGQGRREDTVALLQQQGAQARVTPWTRTNVLICVSLTGSSTISDVFLERALANPRQRFANAPREVRPVTGSSRSFVDARTPAQLLERQRGVQSTGTVEVAIDQAVQHVPKIDATDPTGRVGVANDVDRATVAQQIVELGLVGELVDA